MSFLRDTKYFMNFMNFIVSRKWDSEMSKNQRRMIIINDPHNPNLEEMRNNLEPLENRFYGYSYKTDQKLARFISNNSGLIKSVMKNNRRDQFEEILSQSKYSFLCSKQYE